MLRMRFYTEHLLLAKVPDSKTRNEINGVKPLLLKAELHADPKAPWLCYPTLARIGPHIHVYSYTLASSTVSFLVSGK